MKKLVLSALALSTLFMSCNKESLLPEEVQRNADISLTVKGSNNVGVSEEHPYEIYDPGEGEVYLLLEEGLADLFSEESEEGTTDITRGFWYIESGLNLSFIDTENSETPYVTDYEEIITKKRSLVLNLVDNKLRNKDIRDQITQMYSEISGLINEENKFHLVDVQFDNIIDDQISLNIVSKYYVNPVLSSGSPWAPPTVDPATDNKLAGWKKICGGAISRGAWTDAQIRVKKALPHPVYINRAKFNSNVFNYSSYPFSIGTRKLDGTYLPGNLNAIFSNHSYPLNASTCLFKSEQDAYAQAMANQFHSILGKRYYWDGVAWLKVNASVAPQSQYTDWGYYVDFATWPTMPNDHKITLPWVTFL